MNKALILKYKKEFDHWLNGGSVLVQTEYQGNWYLYKADNSTLWEYTCAELIGMKALVEEPQFKVGDLV